MIASSRNYHAYRSQICTCRASSSQSRRQTTSPSWTNSLRRPNGRLTRAVVDLAEIKALRLGKLVYSKKIDEQTK